LEFLRRNDNGKNVLCALNPDDVIEGTSMTYIDAAKYRAAQIVTNIQNGHFPLSASSERVIESDRESEVLRVVYISEPTPLPANGTASNDQTSVPAKNEVTA
jgi:hypothetical protein